jgi:hypothetical protein
MVDIEFTPIDHRVVVRFMREFQSKSLGRSYMTTELIILVPAEHAEDIKDDFAVYASLPEEEQRRLIEQLRGIPRYTGRLLPSM